MFEMLADAIENGKLSRSKTEEVARGIGIKHPEAASFELVASELRTRMARFEELQKPLLARAEASAEAPDAWNYGATYMG